MQLEFFSTWTQGKGNCPLPLQPIPKNNNNNRTKNNTNINPKNNTNINNKTEAVYTEGLTHPVGIELCPWICCPASFGLDLAKTRPHTTISSTVIVKILLTSILKNSPGDDPADNQRLLLDDVRRGRCWHDSREER